jgi:hypothetical protein
MKHFQEIRIRTENKVILTSLKNRYGKDSLLNY